LDAIISSDINIHLFCDPEKVRH